MNGHVVEIILHLCKTNEKTCPVLHSEDVCPQPFIVDMLINDTLMQVFLFIFTF